LGLDADGIANAIALAASRCSLVQIRRGQIAMDKALSIGQISAASILAALLARRGGTGCSTLFEGGYGLNKVVLGDCDLRSLIDGYDEFLMVWSAIKPYPLEFMTVGMVDAALMLRSRHGIRATDIQKIRVGVFSDAMTKPTWDREKLEPRTREAADHSFNWNIAKALTDGEMTLTQITQNPLEDKSVIDLMQKIDFVIDEELTEIYQKDPGLVPVWMEIITPSGSFVHQLTAPRGHRQNPLTDDEIVDKLRATASWALTDGELERLVEATWALDRLNDVKAEYAPLLVGSKA
jgi:2-methylcitrate dehydratase